MESRQVHRCAIQALESPLESSFHSQVPSPSICVEKIATSEWNALPMIPVFLSAQEHGSRHSGLHQFKELAVLAAIVVALSNQERTEARTAPNRLALDGSRSFNAQSMIEAQWGTSYSYVHGMRTVDGDLVFIFESLSDEAKPYAVQVGPQNECAGMGILVDMRKSEVSDKFSSISSADDCQELCAQTRNCVGATYDESASTCSLMKSLRWLSEGLSTLVVPSCDSGCFQEGKKFDNDGTSLGFAPNPNICQAMCEGESECRAFTWKRTDKQCFSHRIAGNTVADADAVNGLRGSCSVSKKTANYAQSCLVENVSATGDDYRMQRGVGTVQACNEICLSESRCNWFTYNQKDQICFLKNVRGSSLKFFKSGDLTGPKYCDTSCFLKDIEYMIDRVATLTVEDASRCRYECSVHSQCQRWTFHMSVRGCYLFGEVKTAVGKRTPGFWSGFKGGCGAEPLYALNAPSCVQRGVKYNSALLEVLPAETATLCQQKCQANSSCETFAYNTSTKNACEFHGPTSDSQKSYNPYFMAGPKRC
ncbi:micronemal protein 4-like [Cyclospora cayetanensis]|uniref:Micronemal protein 4-like n=1 Tax=Cyclospora cayetanensis TaxID=88456 RepID=A0A6P6S388_9EIME|nr:micronemal protein 4-like [Cyclospora cayetanensis]